MAHNPMFSLKNSTLGNSQDNNVNFPKFEGSVHEIQEFQQIQVNSNQKLSDSQECNTQQEMNQSNNSQFSKQILIENNQDSNILQTNIINIRDTQQNLEENKEKDDNNRIDTKSINSIKSQNQQKSNNSLQQTPKNQQQQQIQDEQLFKQKNNKISQEQSIQNEQNNNIINKNEEFKPNLHSQNQKSKINKNIKLEPINDNNILIKKQEFKVDKVMTLQKIQNNIDINNNHSQVVQIGSSKKLDQNSNNNETNNQKENLDNVSIKQTIQTPNMKSSAHMSEQSYSKVRNQIHQLHTYESVMQDEDLQKSILQRFQPQRQPQWVFKNETLEIDNIQQLKLLTLTWNMQGSLPVINFEQLLEFKRCKHHIIAIGTQECQRSILTSLVCDSKQKWEQALRDHLEPEYYVASSITMNAQFLIVFIHNSLKQQISQIRTNTEATGVANVIGNKGGISIQLNIGQKSYLFINSHLASGQNKQSKRNQDVYKIARSFSKDRKKDVEKIQRQKKAIEDQINRSNSKKSDTQLQKEKEMQRTNQKLLKYESQQEKLNQYFDHVFWMGDMNYRISQDKHERVHDMIENRDFLRLLMIDQLLLEKEKGNIYEGFKEGIIMFPPTYKMNKEANIYPKNEKKKRVPGWTDRILFSEQVENNIQLQNYECGLQIFGSDHRPVFAQFLVNHSPLSDQDINNVQIKQKQSTTACQIF